jgi:sec-independent protein translocase protein TatB
MFNLGWSELLLLAAVALLVIGPKDLPVAMRTVGRYVGKARAMSRHVRSGFDEMVRQAELEEMEKEWKKSNDAIMAGLPGQADRHRDGKDMTAFGMPSAGERDEAAGAPPADAPAPSADAPAPATPDTPDPRPPGA